jgi:ABC-2 type transport system ATP-binding protein
LDTDTPEAITEKFSDTLLALEGKYKQSTIEVLRSFEEVKNAFPFGDSIHITSAPSVTIKRIEQLLSEHKVPYVSLKEIKAGIEDCFMDLMSLE